MINLDDRNSIKNIDKSGMLDLMMGLPRQMEEAARLGREFNSPPDYRGVNSVVFCGLGGSAIGGDVIRALTAGQIKLPIYTNRNYTIPAFIGSKTLVIISSYSGNTEETLSAFSETLEAKAKIMAITSGGKLAEQARENGLPVISIPRGLPPRAALGYSSIPILFALAKLGMIKPVEEDIGRATQLLNKLRDEELAVSVPAPKNPAKTLAKRLHGNLAAIYSAEEIGVTALRLRGQLAENAKNLSWHHLLPEMNHNEIVGWVYPDDKLKELAVILLRDKDEHPRVSLRFKILRAILEKITGNINEISSRGRTKIERIFSLIYQGDFVSLYLAILNGVDPTPVERINYLKSKLAEVK